MISDEELGFWIDIKGKLDKPLAGLDFDNAKNLLDRFIKDAALKSSQTTAVSTNQAGEPSDCDRHYDSVFQILQAERNYSSLRYLLMRSAVTAPRDGLSDTTAIESFFSNFFKQDNISRLLLSLNSTSFCTSFRKDTFKLIETYSAICNSLGILPSGDSEQKDCMRYVLFFISEARMLLITVYHALSLGEVTLDNLKILSQCLGALLDRLVLKFNDSDFNTSDIFTLASKSDFLTVVQWEIAAFESLLSAHCSIISLEMIECSMSLNRASQALEQWSLRICLPERKSKITTWFSGLFKPQNTTASAKSVVKDYSHGTHLWLSRYLHSLSGRFALVFSLPLLTLMPVGFGNIQQEDDDFSLSRDETTAEKEMEAIPCSMSGSALQHFSKACSTNKYASNSHLDMKAYLSQSTKKHDLNCVLLIKKMENKSSDENACESWLNDRNESHVALFCALGSSPTSPAVLWPNICQAIFCAGKNEIDEKGGCGAHFFAWEHSIDFIGGQEEGFLSGEGGQIGTSASLPPEEGHGVTSGRFEEPRGSSLPYLRSSVIERPSSPRPVPTPARSDISGITGTSPGGREMPRNSPTSSNLGARMESERPKSTDSSGKQRNPEPLTVFHGYYVNQVEPGLFLVAVSRRMRQSSLSGEPLVNEFMIKAANVIRMVSLFNQLKFGAK